MGRGIECEVCLDRIRLEHVSEFIYLGCVLDESGTYEAEFSRKVASGGGLQVTLGLWLMLGVCSLSVLRSYMSHCNCLFLRMVVDNLRGLLGIRRMDKVPNARIRQLCEVRKAEDEKNDEGILPWFNHVERMKNDRIAKRVYIGEYAGTHSVGKLRKRWIDTVKDCLKKRGLASKENNV